MSLSRPRIINEPTNFYFSINNPRLHTVLTFPENSEYTKQEFKNECDINIILAQYQHTGEIPNLNERQAQYLDCTGIDYTTHMQKIVEANELFADLPSAIRDRFKNDPASFLDFVHNKSNEDEMRKMGLLRPISTILSISDPASTDVTTEAKLD